MEISLLRFILPTRTLSSLFATRSCNSNSKYRQLPSFVEKKKMERKSKHPGLPPEIIYEILANLSVKHLSKFRCVSKSWNSLISDSSFQQEHYRRRRLQQDPVLLIARMDYVNQYTDPDTLDLSTHDGNVGTDITHFSIPFPVPSFSSTCGAIQICQGLTCVALSTDAFVCIPATREIIALPSFGEEPSHCVGFGLCRVDKGV